jgi:hypothetical protein
MGIFAEYLDRQFGFPELTAERKKQLARIASLRNRDVLVYAADLRKGQAPVQISYPDLLPLLDQLSNLQGFELDLILETPGGYAEIAEQVVRIIRNKYPKLGVIVPGTAKSAGTIMAMAADEILMDASSALGPIDAQLMWQGKIFSADALLKGFDRIKEEVSTTQILNKAYIPILQGISPGELESAQNQLDLAKDLVAEWLTKYKFSTWSVHSSTGETVTPAEKRLRAEEIAAQLCEHSRWRSHGRSIMLSDLQAMKVQITDYSKQPDLADAIRRYFTLLEMTFDTNVYKVFETPTSQIYRFLPATGDEAKAPLGRADVSTIALTCQRCGNSFKVQANLDKPSPLEPGSLPYPKSNKIACPSCGIEHDLSPIRRQLELQTKKKVVTD